MVPFLYLRKRLLKYGNRIGRKPLYFEVSFPESIEIDNYEDLKLAKILCK